MLRSRLRCVLHNTTRCVVTLLRDGASGPLTHGHGTSVKPEVKKKLRLAGGS
ncbi:hypothetical protein QTP86_023916 [Hemibagrus guttatus]|nr:hypothetical protein QTP86_023916 [Hemibagrus guttatus]